MANPALDLGSSVVELFFSGSCSTSQRAGRANQSPPWGTSQNHHRQRENVGRRVPEIIAGADANGLQSWPYRLRAAKSERGVKAMHWIPAREDYERHRHQTLAA